MYTDLEVKIKLHSCNSIISFISNNDIIDLILYMLVKAVEAKMYSIIGYERFV